MAGCELCVLGFVPLPGCMRSLRRPHRTSGRSRTPPRKTLRSTNIASIRTTKPCNPNDVLNPAAILSRGAAALADLERRSLEASSRNKGALPLSQGFANSWIHFYPANRLQASFRCLGVQNLDGRQTSVIAFAQVPAGAVAGRAPL